MYTSQMFAGTTSEVSSSLTNVKKWASAAGYAMDKILDGQDSRISLDNPRTLCIAYPVQRFFLALKKGHKPETFVFF